jgi:hypothetical protein
MGGGNSASLFVLFTPKVDFISHFEKNDLLGG